MSAEEFWAHVDSSTSWRPGRTRGPACTCYSRDGRYHSDICDLMTDWASQRTLGNGRGCLALKSDGDRCGERVTRTFPFCDRYHAESALRGFINHLTAIGQTNVLYGHFEYESMAIAALIQRGMHNHVSDKSKKQLAKLLDFKVLREPPLPSPVEKPERNQNRRCALYRHYDTEGTVLYVGISVDPETRAKAHQTSSPWWEFVASSDIDWYLTEVDASKAERKAIFEDAPIFNKAGASAERDARAIQYLIQHEAYGLLRTAS